MDKTINKELLKRLPKVDDLLKSELGEGWCRVYPRSLVLDGIRQALDEQRKLILDGTIKELDENPMVTLAPIMEVQIKKLAEPSLRGLINATGIVMHTNLGRSPLSERAIENIARTARGYSNLEYDIEAGKRGKRYTHIKRLLTRITGAEDGMAVNNNAGAVLLCLGALAKGREVIVSRGELVEIGGSFRVPDVMEQSGCKLVEVGSTNKTHLRDYDSAITRETGMLLKVHQSNFRIEGFTQDVSIADMVELGRKHNIPVMYDLGSGSLVDMSVLGIHDEPTVQEIMKSAPDILTFSGDKLLGGPQAGIIVGSSSHMEIIAKNPLTRALRIDKLTLAALESTLLEYAELDGIESRIPMLGMLMAPVEEIRKRAANLARAIGRQTREAKVKVLADVTYSGGGALPARKLDTAVVAVSVKGLSPNQLEARLRLGDPAVIGRIKDGVFVLDCRTVMEGQIPPIARAVARKSSFTASATSRSHSE